MGNFIFQISSIDGLYLSFTLSKKIRFESFCNRISQLNSDGWWGSWSRNKRSHRTHIWMTHSKTEWRKPIWTNIHISWPHIHIWQDIKFSISFLMRWFLKFLNWKFWNYTSFSNFSSFRCINKFWRKYSYWRWLWLTDQISLWIRISSVIWFRNIFNQHSRSLYWRRVIRTYENGSLC